MEFNNKKLTRTTKFIQYVISITLAVFLIGLANRIIGDIDDTVTRPELSQFEGETEIRKYRILKNSIEDSIQNQLRGMRDLQLQLDLAQTTLDQEQRSFKSWISTRSATQSSEVDVEVRKRNKSMDVIQKSIRDFEVAKTAFKSKISGLNDEKSRIQGLVNEQMDESLSLYNIALDSYELMVFLKRLLFALPILLLGVWLLLKKRKHMYWPLFRGIVFFSLYAFFVGLVPYLPSYGGYVRYIMGIILSVFLGIHVIRSLRAFIKRKQEELQKTTQERSKEIKQEVAEKALENHMCPSCGKDFLINDIHQSGGKKGPSGTLQVTNYCRCCGLQLFKDCDSCETTNYAHLPHCYSCGDTIMEEANSIV